MHIVKEMFIIRILAIYIMLKVLKIILFIKCIVNLWCVTLFFFVRRLRNFSIKDGKRKARIADKVDKASTDQAIDPKTKVLLFKLVNGGVLDSINGVISTGKEAVILHADGGPGPETETEVCLLFGLQFVYIFKNISVRPIYRYRGLYRSIRKSVIGIA